MESSSHVNAKKSKVLLRLMFVCLFVVRMLPFVAFRMHRTGFNLLGSKMTNTSDSELRSSLDICYMTSNACSWNNCKDGAY